MLTHGQIWAAIDALAFRHDLSPSALAKKAGLDPTSFNKSKRSTADGRERWPSTESVAKILEATSSSLEDFMQLILVERRAEAVHRGGIGGFGEQGRAHGFAEAAALELSAARDCKILISIEDPDAVSLLLSEDYYPPFYCAGDRLVLAGGGIIDVGARVFLELKDGSSFIASVVETSDSILEAVTYRKTKKKQRIRQQDIERVRHILWVGH